MILREPGGQHALWYPYDILIGTTDSHLSLLPVVTELTPLLDKDGLHKLLRNAGVCLTSRIWGSGVSSGPDRV